MFGSHHVDSIGLLVAHVATPVANLALVVELHIGFENRMGSHISGHDRFHVLERNEFDESFDVLVRYCDVEIFG